MGRARGRPVLAAVQERLQERPLRIDEIAFVTQMLAATPPAGGRGPQGGLQFGFDDRPERSRAARCGGPCRSGRGRRLHQPIRHLDFQDRRGAGEDELARPERRYDREEKLTFYAVGVSC